VLDDADEEETKTATIVSPEIFEETDTDQNKRTFSVGAYIFPYSKRLRIELGFIYDIDDEEQLPVYKVFYVESVQQWGFISEIFNMPTTFQNLRVFLNVQYSGPTTDYEFLLHGMTIGQWSEQFNVESLGVSVESIPENVNIESSGIVAKSYGLQELDAYYLSNNNGLCAINSGLPMVFGAKSSTRITPNRYGNPSLIFPGLGFLNESGQYKTFTVEFWAKIQSNAFSARRI
jgi:hypothetical protein